MFGLIAYAVAGIALVGAIAWGWGNFKDWVGEPYAAEQRRADQKVVDAANAAQRKAEGETVAMTGERDHARADTAQCVANVDVQSKAVNEWKATAQRKANEAREAKADADRRASAAAPKLAQLQADAAAKPQLMACEVELGKAKKVLQDALRARRGEPPAPVAK